MRFDRFSGVQGKPHRKIIRDDKKKRIQAGIASDDEGDDEVVVFSEKEEAAMAKIFDKVKAKMPADTPAADDAPPPPAPATIGPCPRRVDDLARDSMTVSAPMTPTATTSTANSTDH